ncbi:hypothetical protein AB0L00_29650 [Actinoallomurus sp. NPDC052308]|uniref:hypothetical protein n=1 Tax=Actinoallomurus sp. NPDC052308 TaxID=3155530 RepID=UPI00343A65D1
MRVKTAAAAIIVATAMMAQTGCDSTGGHGKVSKVGQTPAPGAGSTAASASPSARYTAEQLKRALIDPPAGATRVRTESGPADTVITGFGATGATAAVTAAPGCTASGPAGLGAATRTPTALMSFTQGQTFTTVMLSAVSDAQARQRATRPFPKACRSFKATAGGTTMSARTVTDDPYTLGEGGRIREMDETTSGVHVHLWNIVFLGPDYAASCEADGLDVTRADAERLARQAYRKASATLR